MANINNNEAITRIAVATKTGLEKLQNSKASVVGVGNLLTLYYTKISSDALFAKKTDLSAKVDTTTFNTTIATLATSAQLNATNQNHTNLVADLKINEPFTEIMWPNNNAQFFITLSEFIDEGTNFDPILETFPYSQYNNQSFALRGLYYIRGRRFASSLTSEFDIFTGTKIDADALLGNLPQKQLGTLKRLEDGKVAFAIQINGTADGGRSRFYPILDNSLGSSYKISLITDLSKYTFNASATINKHYHINNSDSNLLTQAGIQILAQGMRITTLENKVNATKSWIDITSKFSTGGISVFNYSDTGKLVRMTYATTSPVLTGTNEGGLLNLHPSPLGSGLPDSAWVQMPNYAFGGSTMGDTTEICFNTASKAIISVRRKTITTITAIQVMGAQQSTTGTISKFEIYDVASRWA